MTDTIILGVDPGLSGALAFYNLVDGVVRVEDMPVVELMRGGKAKREVSATLLRHVLPRYGKISHAYLERVGAMPGQGVSSVFSFGRSVGVVEGVLAAFDVPVTSCRLPSG